MYILAFLVHLIFLISIFDIFYVQIYDKHVKPRCQNSLNPIAKRVVVVIADGLGGNRFYSYNQGNSCLAESCFSRKIMNGGGSWGIAQARIPTFSKPGVFSILAGTQAIPVDLINNFFNKPSKTDTLFNHVNSTVYIGFKGFTNWFRYHANVSKWYSYHYPMSLHYSKTKNGTHVDKWVRDRIAKLFVEAKTNETLHKHITKNGTIFVLHLAGMDRDCHHRGSLSGAANATIEMIDSTLKVVNQTFSEYFSDNETAFVFSADHGMDIYGYHYTKKNAITDVPFLAWGKGIKKNACTSEPLGVLPEWKMGKKCGVLIYLTDIAPLVSALLGAPIPANSIGALPVTLLNASSQNKAKAIYCNSLQIDALTGLSYETQTPQFPLFPSPPIITKGRYEILEKMEESLGKNQYEEAEKLGQDLCKKMMFSIKVLHEYYANILFCLMLISVVTWSLYLLLKVIYPPQDNQLAVPYISLVLDGTLNYTACFLLFLDIFFVSLIIYFGSIALSHSWPPMYITYLCLPYILWWLIFRNLVSKVGEYSVDKNVSVDWLKVLNCIVFFGASFYMIICIVNVAFVFVAIGTLFIFPLMNKQLFAESWIVRILEGCWILQILRGKWILPTLKGKWIVPVVKGKWIVPIVKGKWILPIVKGKWILPIFKGKWDVHILKGKWIIKICWLATNIWIICFLYFRTDEPMHSDLSDVFASLLLLVFAGYLYQSVWNVKDSVILMMLLACAGVAFWNIRVIGNKRNVPTSHLTVSWVLTLCPQLLPILFSSKTLFVRMIQFCLSQSIAVILVSPRDQITGYFILCTLLLCWFQAEAFTDSPLPKVHKTTLEDVKVVQKTEKSLSFQGIRLGLAVCMYCIVGLHCFIMKGEEARTEFSWFRAYFHKIYIGWMTALGFYFVLIPMIIAVMCFVAICKVKNVDLQRAATWVFLLLNNLGIYSYIQAKSMWPESQNTILTWHVISQIVPLLIAVCTPLSSFTLSFALDLNLNIFNWKRKKNLEV